MTTVINNPGEGSNNSAGLIIGLVVAAILVFAFIRWGLPAMRGGDDGASDINIELPTINTGGGEGGAGGSGTSGN